MPLALDAKRNSRLSNANDTAFLALEMPGSENAVFTAAVIYLGFEVQNFAQATSSEKQQTTRS